MNKWIKALQGCVLRREIAGTKLALKCASAFGSLTWKFGMLAQIQNSDDSFYKQNNNNNNGFPYRDFLRRVLNF